MEKLFCKIRGCIWWCRNIWRFRKALWKYRTWDNEYVYPFLHTHLDTLEKAFAEDKWHTNVESNLRHVRTCKALVERIIADDYVSMYYRDVVDTNSLFGIRLEKRAMVNEKATTPYNSKHRDIQYLYKLLAKHGEDWWI